MPEDLPIYSQSTLRSGSQFSDLEGLKTAAVASVWENFDQAIRQMEGASNVAGARSALTEPSKECLIRIHSILFRDRPGAGQFRRTPISPLYRGQDCPSPQHIDRALANFFGWLSADSFLEIHAIEKTALVLTRLADIWPFEFGNRPAALVFSNFFLHQAGYAPFLILKEQSGEFEKVLELAILMQTQPLVNTIYNSVKREMQALVGQ